LKPTISQPSNRKGLVLAVNQRATLDISVTPGSVSASITVTTQAPLLDTADASLGTDVSNGMSATFRSPTVAFSVWFFSRGGVTETAGQGTEDCTRRAQISFRTASATPRPKFASTALSLARQNKGKALRRTSTISRPSKSCRNSKSKITVSHRSSAITAAGRQHRSQGRRNKFHGSGWWFGQRSALDANGFQQRASLAKPDHARDQYGFPWVGPLRRKEPFSSSISKSYARTTRITSTLSFRPHSNAKAIFATAYRYSPSSIL